MPPRIRPIATFRAFIEARDSGEVVEIDSSMFNYWLGVLPPVWMNRQISVYRLPPEERYNIAFGFAEGAEPVTAFWSRNGRYFCTKSYTVAP